MDKNHQIEGEYVKMVQCPECGFTAERDYHPPIVKIGNNGSSEVVEYYYCPNCKCEFKEKKEIKRDITVIKHGENHMSYYLATFEERIGDTTIILHKIIKASSADKAEQIARNDAMENSCWDVGFEAIRKLKYIKQIRTLDDIPSPFFLEE